MACFYTNIRYTYATRSWYQEQVFAKLDGLDLTNKTDLSLFLLLIKVKIKFKSNPSSINLIVDEGINEPGNTIGSLIFHDWPEPYSGVYSSSTEEPLLQLADFIAFCINRTNHLAMKTKRTNIDDWFLNLVGRMEIDCVDFKPTVLPVDFTVEDFDFVHSQDKAEKGL